MIKLNIGCGPNVFPHPGWINYDREDIRDYLYQIVRVPQIGMPDHQIRLIEYLRSGGEVDFRLRDLRDGFPMHEDGSVDTIYLGQMIEHINPIYEAPKFLSECRRMLKPGGIVRITTPDLDLLINCYLNGEMNKFEKEQPDFYKNAAPSAQLAYLMYGASGPGCTWDNYEGHMCLYTKASMENLLVASGFQPPFQFYSEPKSESENPLIAQEVVDAGMSHSLAVEAIKQ